MNDDNDVLLLLSQNDKLQSRDRHQLPLLVVEYFDKGHAVAHFVVGPVVVPVVASAVGAAVDRDVGFAVGADRLDGAVAGVRENVVVDCGLVVAVVANCAAVVVVILDYAIVVASKQLTWMLSI